MASQIPVQAFRHPTPSQRAALGVESLVYAAGRLELACRRRCRSPARPAPPGPRAPHAPVSGRALLAIVHRGPPHRQQRRGVARPRSERVTEPTFQADDFGGLSRGRRTPAGAAGTSGLLGEQTITSPAVRRLPTHRRRSRGAPSSTSSEQPAPATRPQTTSRTCFRHAASAHRARSRSGALHSAAHVVTRITSRRGSSTQQPERMQRSARARARTPNARALSPTISRSGSRSNTARLVDRARVGSPCAPHRSWTASSSKLCAGQDQIGHPSKHHKVGRTESDAATSTSAGLNLDQNRLPVVRRPDHRTPQPGAVFSSSSFQQTAHGPSSVTASKQVVPARTTGSGRCRTDHIIDPSAKVQPAPPHEIPIAATPTFDSRPYPSSSSGN